MELEIKAWLFDIKTAIANVENYLTDRPKIFAEYKKDMRTKQAVERNIEIIGEATKRILNFDSTIQITNARKIVATRNRIIHGYDTILDEHIWAIVVNDLPLLKEEVHNLLNE
ncbi:MAG: DUF86 domain-containing protein [Bacteroidetes bacterium]|nr:DUF86 domain-containing protein [Bacteroidota bacterium]